MIKAIKDFVLIILIGLLTRWLSDDYKSILINTLTKTK